MTVGGTPGGGRRCACTVRCLGRLACEFVLESADYRRLDCRGRRPHKLAHFLELGHDGLALDAELFREFVNPNLRHCAPSTRPGTTGPVSRPGQRVLRPASACAVHRRMLIGRSLQVSLLSSGASGCRHRHNAPTYPATRRIDTPLPSEPAVPSAGEGPAETPCGAGLVPSMPGLGAGMHLGQAVAWSRREPVRFPLPPREPSQVSPHVIRTRHKSGSVRLARSPAYRPSASAPPVTGSTGSGPAETAAGPVSPVSGLISMRQPVSRAASRAFCPSLPMASDS
jgi:hypothetical protein